MNDGQEVQLKGLEVYGAQVLAPLVWPDREPLDVGALQSVAPIPYAQAESGEYAPVGIGWRWGPAWSTAWFRLRGEVPGRFEGERVALRFSSGTEALLWRDGEPVRGFDVNRDDVVLFERASGGERIDLLVEGACNHPFGIGTFEWDDPEVTRRWRDDPTPGRLERAELAVYDEAAWRLFRSWSFATGLLRLLEPGSERFEELIDCTKRAQSGVSSGDIERSLSSLEQGLASAPPKGASRCFAVGHAHLDTAWLWPIRETRRKAMRSFSNVLGLMDRFDDFSFMCSQAQQYAWLEEDAPGLFDRIRERVDQGRWEPTGAMWIEPDCNVPSGESLVRQIIHGVRYWRSRFGDNAPQRLLYLPDTFGFPASLPQIMALGGLDTFVTNKLHWNATNRFPHTTFRWRGIDGTEVLAHNTPGGDYNATNSPRELRKGAATNRHAGPVGLVWLQPFGYGDGGGGPTDWQILNARLACECEGLPRVELSTSGEFCERLHDEVSRREDVPTWNGELYLELHRGTLTTQGWIKRANRKSEEALRECELLCFGGPDALDGEQLTGVRERLDEAWKLVLLNQFHDILPGSSIGWVYDDARKDFERVDALVSESSRVGADTWAGDEDVVFNASTHGASGVVESDIGLRFVRGAQGLGTSAMAGVESEPRESVSASDRMLSNGLVRVVIDDAGRIGSLLHEPSGREACAEPVNQLVLYEDRPHMWDAWDIDEGYERTARPVASAPERIELVEQHPLRSVIEVERPIGRASRIVQRYVLEAESPLIRIESRVDWREEHVLLRALFPVDVLSDDATYEIQFGHCRRATHRNTSWEAAKFEVCAHRWMDLSEPGFGVALLNDCKYGHSCLGNVMGMSLLRSPTHPDPEADRGTHEFVYGVMAHAGGWREAGVEREAERLNRPMRTMRARAWSPITVDGDVEVTALTRAEDSDGVLVRLFETHGARTEATIRWNSGNVRVRAVDLLERDIESSWMAHDGDTTRLALRPFQIVTLIAERV